jgi:putative nucleotidyltransferase with HDIG domain
MAARTALRSLFSQRLDRAVLAVYMLGGVAPLLALGWVVQRYAIPAHEGEGRIVVAWVAGLLALGVLSLGLYLALARITRTALARMDADNLRLARLLEASRSIGSESHAEAVATRTAHCAEEMVGARGAHVVVAERDKEIRFLDEAAASALDEPVRESILELSEAALRDRQPVLLEDGGGSPRSAAAVPFEGGRGALVVLEPGGGAGLAPEGLDALHTLTRLAGVALHNAELRDTQRNFFTYVTELLVNALDGHVECREHHATHVARLSLRLGRELALPADRLEVLHVGALLHDLGMLRLDRTQHRNKKAVRKHSVVGARMIARIRLWEPAAPVVLHHHEWWDGTGYPEGLRGEAIPVESRIIAVADVADAMRRDELDRPGAGLDEIVTELQACAGTQFDPAVVDAFVVLAQRGELGDPF